MTFQRDDATTNEMRHDWLADRWVIIAPQRTERPNDFVHRPIATTDNANCPFCFGHEEETPDAVACYIGLRSGSSRRWNVRVVPNKFPAVNAALQASELPIGNIRAVNGNGSHLNQTIARDAATIKSTARHTVIERSGTQSTDTQPTDKQHANAEQAKSNLVQHRELVKGSASESAIDLFRRRDLTGGHEVIVESPFHLQSISQLDRESTRMVFTAYRDRLRYWLSDRELAYAVVFKNVGQDAGASLRHTHSQLIATDILPTDVERAVQRMQLFSQKESICLFCRMAEDELEQNVRIVEQTPEFIAFCPFASRLPSQVTILPIAHQTSFECLSDPQLEQLSWMTHRLVRRIERCYPEAAYNFIIHTAPNFQKDSDCFHWRLELFPRLTKVAGFEWGSDCYINPIAPESAAAALRRAGV